MPIDFLGVGWEFPVKKDESGLPSVAKYEDCIRRSIWIILGTSRGERMMRPDFGCGINDLVFSTNTPRTLGQLAREVQRALLLWEPRIDVLNVHVDPTNNDAVLLININYQVRSTNNVFNLVYPFYLERSAG